MLSVAVSIFLIYHNITFTAAGSTFHTVPVSVTALVEKNALFHCNGSGATIVWIVDGQQENEISIIQRGIYSTLVPSSGTLQSTLTVPVTPVNNGTTVQCVLYPGEVTSDTATLTVLPGEL